MMRRFLTTVCLIGYAGAALFTFGHAASGSERRGEARRIECRSEGQEYCPTELDIPGASGILAGMLWPLYWSWELQT